MAAVTAAAHDGLLERGTTAHRCDGGGVCVGEPFVNHFSPLLYATPEPTQIASSSPTSMSPSLSPYVVNHKRRDFRVPAAAAAAKPKVDAIAVIRKEANDKDLDLNEGGGLIVERVEGGENDLDDFFSPTASAGVMTHRDTGEGGISSRSQVLGKNTAFFSSTQYYDATEDFGSDSCSSQASPLRSCTEADLRSARLNMFDEIERRKKVEESLLFMQNQWKKMGMQFSKLGLSFPPIPDESNMQSETDVIGHVFEEFVVVRSVSEAIERGVIQAEIESSIEAKNKEISRLHERLRYYETVNLEMSQRNQKTVEISRRKCQKRRRRQRWIWGSIGLSFTIGASLLAYYSLIPPTSRAEQQEEATTVAS